MKVMAPRKKRAAKHTIMKSEKINPRFFLYASNTLIIQMSSDYIKLKYYTSEYEYIHTQTTTTGKVKNLIWIFGV